MSLTLKNKFLKIFILLVIINLKTYAQFLDKNFYLVDSLSENMFSQDDKNVLSEQLKVYNKNITNDTLKIQCLSRIVENTQNEKIWIKYNRLIFNLTSEKINKSKNPREIFVLKSYHILAINNFGYYYVNFTNFHSKAISHYTEAVGLAEEIKDYDNIVNTYANLANVYQNEGSLVKALQYYQKLQAFEKNVSNKNILLAPTNNLAQIYIYLGDTIKAIQTLKKCFQLSKKSSDKYMKGTLLNNIGLLEYYNRKKNGLQTIKKALEYRKEINDTKGVAQTLAVLAGIANNEKNLNLAEDYLIQAHNYLKNIKYPYTEALYYYQLGRLNLLKQKNKEAIIYFEKSVNIYTNISAGIDLANALNILIEAYKLNPKVNAEKLNDAYALYLKTTKTINQNNAEKIFLNQKYSEDIKVSEEKHKAEQLIKEQKNSEYKNRQRLILISVLIIVVFLLVFSFFIYRALKINKQKSTIITKQKIEVEKQKHLIEEKHKDITDSITYAHRIQSSLIPSQGQINKTFKNISLFFQPRDIVSGDFYWFSQQQNTTIFALADCTGHGVPGAFMSIIGINQLNTVVNEKGLTQPSLILNELKKGVITSLNSSSDSDKKDGMDIALISFNDKQLSFSGANQSIYILRNKELIELKGNKQPIGLSDTNQDFSEVKFDLLKHDRIILYSDGLVDQFGGQEGKKLKSKNLKIWLIETADLKLEEQKELIAKKLNTFKQNFEQTDDITLAIIEI